LRVVLLTAHTWDGDVQHRYVAKKLIAEFGDELKAIVVAAAIRKPLRTRLGQWWRRYSLAQLLSRISLRISRKLYKSDERRQRTFQSILFPEGDDGRMPGGVRVARVPSHNSSECLALIARFKADVVVVYGTLIIGRRLIDACRRPLNLHTGFSPLYRGSDTIFWPLHNGEPEHVGVTVHRLVQGVDAGPILARGRPRISSSDDEDTLFAKSVILGVDLLCSAIRREAEGASLPMIQVLEEGLEYRSVMRTVRAEQRTRQKLRAGLLKEGLEECREEF
jgi:methionyl-tRNA formyltransferase